MRTTLAALAFLGLASTAQANDRHSFTFDAKCKPDSLVETNTDIKVPMPCDFIVMTFYPETHHIMLHFTNRHDKKGEFLIGLASNGLEDNQEITDPSVFIPIQRLYIFNTSNPKEPHVIDLGDKDGGCLMENQDQGKDTFPKTLACDAWVSGNGTKAHYKLDANIISLPAAVR